MRVVTANEMRSLDKRTIEELGLPGIVLMEHAGRAVARVVEEQLEGNHGGSVLVCAYKGNNGGDGFVAARLLANSGYEVDVALFCHPHELGGDAEANFGFLEAFPVNVYVFDGDQGWEQDFDDLLGEASVIVDALLGTGIQGAVRPPLDRVIQAINAQGGPHGARVVAVDLPSGLDADKGTYANACIQADVTVTMALPKLGLVIYPGRRLAGQLVVADISIPEVFVNELSPARWLIGKHELADLLPARPEDAHKGTFGRLYVIAGSPGFTGAATLTASAAVRTGAGLVTVGAPEAVHDLLEVKLTEAMTEPLADDSDGRFDSAALEAVQRRLAGVDALALGPGIGRGGTLPEFVHRVLAAAAQHGVPTVIDADGLNALADTGAPTTGLKALSELGVRAILTPHPGELGRLLSRTPAEIQGARIDSALEAARLSGAVVVLKGASTVVASPEGEVALNLTGNSGMASGGTGDVLTGIIGGLLAQGVPPLEAACAGVYVHGRAGELVERDIGERALTASDMIATLPQVWLEFEHHHHETSW